MRLMWHIFKKDARRLALPGAATIGLLAWWANLDRSRWGFTPGPVDGWLNILVPFAWACLIGLLVLQDPPVGDRQFWVTMPVRWWSVLAAKTLFVLAFILVPYFAAQMAILGFQGFQPLAHLPHLLWKELLLLAVIVLPAAAIAAVVRNVAQFTLAAVLVAAVVIFATGSVRPFGSPFVRIDEARLWLALIPALAGAAAIVFVQYRARRTAIARAVGVALGAAAIAIYAWLPPAASAAFRAALHPAPQGAGLRLSLSPIQQPFAKGIGIPGPPQAMRLALPLEIAGVPPGAQMSLMAIALQIHAANGETYQAAVLPNTFRGAQLVAFTGAGTGKEAYLMLIVERSLYSRLRSGPVTLEGRIVASFQRRGREASLPVGGRTDVPGLGICSSALVPGSYTNREMLKVNCASTGEIPPTRVTLVDPTTGREWRHALADAGTFVSYPRSTWLSPLNQRDTFVHVASEDTYQRSPGARYMVPQEVLATARIEIVPQLPAGSSMIKLSLPNVNLKSYELAPQR